MKTLFLFLLLLICLSSFSQGKTTPPGSTASIVHVFMGYVIRLTANAEGRYSYDIVQQGRTVISQIFNPFNSSLVGLATIDDALKIAQWQIKQLVAGAPPSVVTEQPLLQTIAHQLKINTK